MNSLWFLVGCLGTRALMALIVKNLPKHYLPYAGTIGLIISITMASLYIFKLRQRGAEAGGLSTGPGKIWWNDVRPIHAALYLVFACYAFQEKSYAYVPLVIDPIFGLAVWYSHYYL